MRILVMALAATLTVQDMLWQHFQTLPEAEQRRIVQLGMNANWLLDRLKGLDPKALEIAKPFIDALTMGMDAQGSMVAPNRTP